MRHGSDPLDRSHDRGRHGGGERGPEAGEGLTGPLAALVAAAGVLILAGAAFERWLQKRQLRVLDGAAAAGERPEAAQGAAPR